MAFRRSTVRSRSAPPIISKSIQGLFGNSKTLVDGVRRRLWGILWGVSLKIAAFEARNGHSLGLLADIRIEIAQHKRGAAHTAFRDLARELWALDLSTKCESRLTVCWYCQGSVEGVSVNRWNAAPGAPKRVQHQNVRPGADMPSSLAAE
jgi:hypothetical protein